VSIEALNCSDRPQFSRVTKIDVLCWRILAFWSHDLILKASKTQEADGPSVQMRICEAGEEAHEYDVTYVHIWGVQIVNSSVQMWFSLRCGQ